MHGKTSEAIRIERTFFVFFGIVPVIITSYPTYNVSVRIDLINCQSVSNKRDETVDVDGEVGFDAADVTKTWLTGDISGKKIVGDMTPVGYSFHHAAHTN